MSEGWIGVKAWLAVGKDVRIFTARVCSGQSQEEIDVFLREYTRWCFRVFGRQLPVTCEKDWNRLREALKEIAKFADSEYGKRIPAPSCVEFSTIKQYAEKALKGAENE